MKITIRRLLLVAAISASMPAPAVPTTLGFSQVTAPSASWLEWAGCGDFPWLMTDAYLHPVLVGSLTFDAPERDGFFRLAPGDFEFRSNLTDASYGWTAYAQGWVSGGALAWLDVQIDFTRDGLYAPTSMHLLPVSPVPEPLTVLLMAVGLGAISLRRAS